jgi:hypothetical protein
MKVCPQCDRTYYDDELNFCLMDGTALFDGASQPTVSIDAASATETVAISPRATNAEQPRVVKRSNYWIPLSLAITTLLVGVVLGGTGLYFLLNRQNAPSAGSVQNDDRPAKGAKVTPTKMAKSPSPTPADTDNTENQNEIGAPVDAIPVLWFTTGAPFENDKSDFSTFFCPNDGSPFPVFGTDTYESGSSICTAAVHAGLITFEWGGKVKVEFVGGRAAYRGSERNGVSSLSASESDGSFLFPER